MNRIKYLIISILYILILTTNSIQAQIIEKVYFPPKNEWLIKFPEETGMDRILLDQAVKYAEQNENKTPRDLKMAHYQSFGREPFGDAIGPFKDRGEATGLIIHKGYIVASWGDPSRVDQTFSVAKSFLSTTAGLAYDQGLIKSVHDKVYPQMAPVMPYEPWKLSMNRADAFNQSDVIELFDTPHNRKITWDHLLRQTSDWEGTLWGKPDWADRPDRDVNKWYNRPLVEPGTVYEYNDTRVNLLALALLNIWRKPLPQVLKEQVMDPIGASATWRWTGYDNSWVVMDGMPVQSVSGGSHWGGGLYINAYDQARFGYLTLRNGNWKGQQIISETWLKMAKTPTPAQPTYGFMNFFLNDEKKSLPSAPETAFYHLGAGNNFIYVDPENDLVIVARWIRNDAMDPLVGKVLKAIKK